MLSLRTQTPAIVVSWFLLAAAMPATLDTFKERRRPTQAELIAAAPNHPVYVQLGYGWAMLTPLALDALGINPARHQALGTIKARIEALQEANPMLGHRGCRLGITFPEIYEMQVRAIMEAACEVATRGVRVEPEIMIPLTGTVREMETTREMTVRIADRTVSEMGGKVGYTVGTMIEVPRGAVTADEIAKEAEFFSFGTNDLTQMGFGLSRDDAARFLLHYIEIGLLDKDPFVSLDASGVGQLVEIGVKKGRSVKPKLKIGVCGEHGGDPSSIRFFHTVGLDYVSCSPYRVPIARLAAAQAQLEKPVGD